MMNHRNGVRRKNQLSGSTQVQVHKGAELQETDECENLKELMNRTGRRLLVLKALLVQEWIVTNKLDSEEFLSQIKRFALEVEIVDSIRMERCATGEMLRQVALKKEKYHDYSQELLGFADELENRDVPIDVPCQKLPDPPLASTQVPLQEAEDEGEGPYHCTSDTHNTRTFVNDCSSSSRQVFCSTMLESDQSEAESDEVGSTSCTPGTKVGITEARIGKGESKCNFSLDTSTPQERSNKMTHSEGHNYKVIRKTGTRNRPLLRDAYFPSPISKTPQRRSGGNSLVDSEDLLDGSVNSKGELSKSKLETWFDVNARRSRSSLNTSFVESASPKNSTCTKFSLRDYIKDSPASSPSLNSSCIRSTYNKSPKMHHYPSHQDSDSSDSEPSFPVKEFPCVGHGHRHSPRTQRNWGRHFRK